MEKATFDDWVRRAARVTDRRTMICLFGGVILAIVPSRTLAGNNHGHGSGGGGKHDGGKKGGKDKGGKKKHKKNQKGGMSREECENNYGTCVDYWANYCNAFYTGNLRSNCQTSFISCCADLLTCTEQANARHVECATLMDQIW